MNQLFGLIFCAMRQNTFHPHHDSEQVNLWKKNRVFFHGLVLRNWKIAAFLKLAKNRNFPTKF